MADAPSIVSYCTHMPTTKQQNLLNLLNMPQDLLNVTLGLWNSTTIQFDLKEGSTCNHSKPYLSPQLHLDYFKNEKDKFEFTEKNE